MDSVRRKIVFSALLTLVAGACASTRLVDVWVDEARSGAAFQNILVVAMSESERDRRIFEDRFVSELRARGAHSAPSYSVLPAASEMERESISEAVRAGGFDGVLINHHAGSDEQSVYVPGRTRTEVYGRGHPRHRLDNFYWGTWETVSDPGYYDKLTTVFLETNIYETRDGTLVWSGRSESFNPQSTLEIIDTLSKAVAESLEKSDML
ncbi:MAG: hypothetical protein JRG96_11360 [Deltaproteobacteria bacterium]|nr:hypothetical protein [Deltaproteobacteria bacterium]